MITVLGPIAHEIYKQHRDIVAVVTPTRHQGFYRSTGIHSGRPNVWFPFDGLCFYPGFGLWFVKTRFILPEQLNTPLYRFGEQELLQISDTLYDMQIPKSTNVMAPKDINIFLDNQYTKDFNSILEDFLT